MSAYQLLRHKDFEYSTRNLPEQIRRKAIWAQVLLGTRGRTPSVKGTSGFNARWRRTPVQGNHYYMWWIPRSESVLAEGRNGMGDRQSILIHSIRHHDQTDEPIDLGTLFDYEEIPVNTLDPRYEEQKTLSRSLLQHELVLNTVKGLPGSGKTVSLLYLVKDIMDQIGDGDLLYVTYTDRLKRAAEEFLYAQGERFRQRVQIRTLNEIEQEITGIPTRVEPFAELAQFCQFLDLQKSTTLGPWKKYPQALYTEIRAHMLGRAFPPDYQLPENEVTRRIFSATSLSAAAYAANRRVDQEAAEIVYSIAERAGSRGHFFREQLAARRALKLLLTGDAPDWLPQLNALIVDEIQDLTLLQIALLGELAQVRTQHYPGAPFLFTVAGDESQIVQPSGFDWGTTKNLLGERLGTWPEEFEFRHQRRSPRSLAQLIDNSWNFYGHLPKRHRPSAQRQSFVDIPPLIPAPQSNAVDISSIHTLQKVPNGYEAVEKEQGTIFICSSQSELDIGRRANGSNEKQSPQKAIQLDSNESEISEIQWEGLLEELADKPGRVLIDLTERLRTTLPEPNLALGEEILFLSREIKGLERAIVVIYGLNEVYEQAIQLCEDVSGNMIPKFEARRLFDEMRVALSRSTNKLILLESSDASVLAELDVSQIVGTEPLGWEEMLDTLQAEEMSEIEVIEGYLDEADDLFERGRWEQGYRRNRRAHLLASRLEDTALIREVEEQYIQGHLQETNSLLAHNQWHQAHQLNRRIHVSAAELDDDLLIEQINDQHQQIRDELAYQARQHQSQANEWYTRKSYKIAYVDAQTAYGLANMLDDEELLSSTGTTLAEICHHWAYQLTGDFDVTGDIPHATELLQEAASVMTYLGNIPHAESLQILAQRYKQIPQRHNLSTRQISQILHYAQQYMAAYEDGEESSEFAHRWLEETFASLVSKPRCYYRWASTAQQLATSSFYPEYDEHLWELENHMEKWLTRAGRSIPREIAKFQAFILAYNGDATAASVAWEEIGEFEFAAQQARAAGDVERAYTLLRQTKESIPETLTVAAKALRYLHQLEQKHRGLIAPERQALSEKLNQLAEMLVQEDEPEVDDDIWEILDTDSA